MRRQESGLLKLFGVWGGGLSILNLRSLDVRFLDLYPILTSFAEIFGGQPKPIGLLHEPTTASLVLTPAGKMVFVEESTNILGGSSILHPGRLWI